jgi:hypothetical protein
MVKLFCQPITDPPLSTFYHDVVNCEPAVSASFSLGDKVIVSTQVMGSNEHAMFFMNLLSFKCDEMYWMNCHHEQCVFHRMFTEANHHSLSREDC